MREEDIEPLRAALNKKCTLTEDDFIPKVHIDVAMPMGYADDALAGEFALLEPFGTGNPRPLFAQKGLVFQAGFKMGANKTCADTGGYDTDGGIFWRSGETGSFPG